jgi:hypothetical protein
MNGSQVGVLEQRHKVSLSGFLKSHHSRGLEAQVGLHSRNVSSAQPLCNVAASTMPTTYLEVLGDLTDETLEWEFTDEKFRRLLIPTNLAQCDGTRAEPVRLLHATSSSLK